MKSAKELVDDAMAQVRTLAVDQAQALLGRADVLFVDLRERSELESQGLIPGSLHVPRGLLEFWVDPGSPWHRGELAPDKALVLYCAVGWRSALAAKALQEMGRPQVSHLAGGFDQWKAAGGPVVPLNPPS